MKSKVFILFKRREKLSRVSYHTGPHQVAFQKCIIYKQNPKLVFCKYQLIRKNVTVNLR